MRNLAFPVLLILVSCTSAPVRKLSTHSNVNLEIRWERGRCLENCASFTLIARDDGTASCIGLKKVGLRGRFDSDLNIEIFHETVQQLREKGLFEKLIGTQKFPSVRNKNAISYFTITEGGTSLHYWAEAGSPEIKDYEALFEKMESTIQWDLKNRGNKRLSCLKK